eukprot:UN26338
MSTSASSSDSDVHHHEFSSRSAASSQSSKAPQASSNVRTVIHAFAWILHEITNSLNNSVAKKWKNIRKEICWIISNITAGKERHIQHIVNDYMNINPTSTINISSKKNLSSTCQRNNITNKIYSSNTNNSINLIPILIHRFYQERDLDIKREIVWTFRNLLAIGNEKHVLYIIQNGAIELLCTCLDLYRSDQLIIRVSLEGLQQVLERGYHCF